MTYKELYAYGVLKLQEVAIGEASLDGRLLLEWICKTNRNDLLVHGDRKIGQEVIEKYMVAIERRAKHEPLQYITQCQEFMGLSFFVNPSVLIPRQDTEVLVEVVMKHLHDGMKVLDMCTGSGCILLSLLHYSNGCKGMGVDISEEALTVAKKNANTLNIEGATFLQSDLFAQVEGCFDVIVSNPPYIKTAKMADLMEEVKGYEPSGALDGKANGLFFYEQIIAQSKDYLSNGGFLFFEIGYDQAKAVSELMELAEFVAVDVIKDFAGMDRVVYGLHVKR